MRTTGIAALLAVSLIAVTGVAVAQATPVQVYVRIEGQNETLFEGPVWTEGHDIQASSDTAPRSCDGINPLDPENHVAGPTPTAAAVDALSLIDGTFDGRWYPGYNDYLITRWGPDAEAEGMSWGILVNDVFTSVGGCQYELSTDDEVLWAYNAFGHKPFLALLPVAAGYISGARPLTAMAELDKPFEVEVLDYDNDTESKPPAVASRTGSWPYEGADVAPVQTNAQGFEKVQTESPQTVTTDSHGKASITFTEAGWHRIKTTALGVSGKEDVIRSNRLDVCVPAEGEDGCGPPPPEDQIRTPARYTKEEVKEERELTPPAATDNQAGPPSASSSPSNVATATQADPHVSSSIFAFAVQSLNPSRLLLKLTSSGKVVVKIERQVGRESHLRWHTIKAIKLTIDKAGPFKVSLPRLAAGHYRVSVSFATAKAVVRTLIVPGRRG